MRIKLTWLLQEITNKCNNGNMKKNQLSSDLNTHEEKQPPD